MVLICNNNLLTIEQFHKNRCDEKNQIKDILIKMKYNSSEFELHPPAEIKEMPLPIKPGRQNTGITPINTKNYDCKNKEN
jgi:hypothetical protein